MAYNPNNLTPAELQRIHNEFERQEENNLAQVIAESERNEKQRVRQEEERERLEIQKKEREIRDRERRERERQERERQERERQEREARERQENLDFSRAIKESLKLGASLSGVGSSGASSIGASSSGPSSSIISEISAITTELMKSQTITMYIKQLTYLIIKLPILPILIIPILKIPIFVHYNNLAFYSISANNVKACSFKYKSEDIYLVSQYVLFDDMEDKNLCPNLEFRPNAFYMEQQASYVEGTHLNFKGKLEIYNIKTKKITIKDNVEVHSHDGTFSPLQNLLSFDELQINKDSGESFFYYVVFRPIHKPDLPDLPIFKGFYWLQMMPDKVIDKPCDTILHKIQNALSLKGGNYLQLKHKSKLHKTKLHKTKLHKTKLHKTKLHKSKLHKSKSHKSKLHKTKL